MTPASARGSRRAAIAASLCLVASATLAQQAEPAPTPRDKIDKSQFELRGLEGQIQQTEEQKQRIQADIETMRNDRARLNSALIDATAKARAAQGRVGDAQERLDTALASESAIRKSLDGRREVIAEVLAALQRIGRKPPPAVLASPDDILKAVRASMLLGAVVPELRAETEALASDLADLVKAREQIAAERASLERESAGLANELQRLSGLIDARQAAMADAQRTLDTQGAKIAELARQATDLKDLIARMELEIAPNAAASGARNPASGQPRDPARLAPAVAFSDAKGTLAQPVSGTLVKQYGAQDGFGGTERGVSFSTRPGAIVSAPCDAWIVYSGPWRTFGQLLILNAGDGYYIVLAGMSRNSVSVGQFVLAGEPVGAMGDGSVKTAASIAIGAALPVLYVEFRKKDGTAVDPGPWWAKPDLERVRG